MAQLHPLISEYIVTSQASPSDGWPETMTKGVLLISHPTSVWCQQSRHAAISGQNSDEAGNLIRSTSLQTIVFTFRSTLHVPSRLASSDAWISPLSMTIQGLIVSFASMMNCATSAPLHGAFSSHPIVLSHPSHCLSSSISVGHHLLHTPSTVARSVSVGRSGAAAAG